MQWDKQKAIENDRKHSIRFSDVEPVFYDPPALTVEDPLSETEQRVVTIGRDGFDRVLYVVYTYVDNDVRLISARKASPGEVKYYEREN